MKKFKKNSLGEEFDLKEYNEILKKEFKEKFTKFKKTNEEKIKVEKS